jgi:Doubled CXXCH motif (Paired_CXXCH_1)
VPVSPRTQGRAVLAWSASAKGLPDQHGTLTVTAIARATGLTSLAVGQRVMLGGGAYALVRAPGGSHASVLDTGSGVATFAPDVAGRYQLRGPGGERLEIQAMRHDHTPMDCGRSECHASISASTLVSPMSHALSHPALDLRADRSCMLGCHAVGEPGLDDGGFASLRAALAHTAPLDGAHLGALPPQLMRMAGVRCTSCHGPGAIPTQGGRARVLRSDVCATCHDSPPRYTHVSEWRSSAMARADSHAGSDTPACAACHTTGGFLHRTGLRVRDDLSRDDTAVGITCAACHAPHGARLAAGLVRDFEGPSSLPKGAELAHTPSALCAQCHAPQEGSVLPEASSAALWLGSAAFPASLGGEPLAGPAPHAELAGGCLACHGKRNDDGARKHTGHDFAVDPAVCTSCHTGGAPDAGRIELTARVSALRARLATSCPSPEGAHAAGTAPCQSAALGRARYALELVARDAAAHAHNAPFARALLDRAEAELARSR